jgi:DNA-binding transcriptional MerR regulator
MEKEILTIAQVADILKEKPFTLRFWEKEYKIKIERRNNRRQYTREDVDKFKNIQYLRRTQGFSSDGAKKKLTGKNKDKVDKVRSVVETLTAVKKELSELRRKINENQPFAQSVIV